MAAVFRGEEGELGGNGSRPPKFCVATAGPCARCFPGCLVGPIPRSLQSVVGGATRRNVTTFARNFSTISVEPSDHIAQHPTLQLLPRDQTLYLRNVCLWQRVVSKIVWPVVYLRRSSKKNPHRKFTFVFFCRPPFNRLKVSHWHLGAHHVVCWRCDLQIKFGGNQLLSHVVIITNWIVSSMFSGSFGYEND